jgi:hypothetical protein
MAASLSYLLNDNSTYANYFSWASPISAALIAAGWVQSPDTGQVMWSGLSITAVSMSGTTMTCTYSSQTGLALAIGRALTVAGWTSGNVGNNGTFVITGGTLTAGSGTFTATNAAGVNVASGGTGVVTATSVVPTTNTYLYEIWQPNDGLANFFLKLEYGNYSSGTNAPTIAATLGTLTNGAGVFVGLSTSRFVASIATNAAASSTVPYECRFSGGAGYFGAMLWKTIANGQMLYVERSVNSSGAYVGNHVTLVVIGCVTTGNVCTANQQTLTLGGLGAAPVVCTANTSNYNQGLEIRCPNPRVSQVFNSSVPVDNLVPCVGYFDYPLLGLAGMSYLAVSEGQTITIPVYGTNHTYYCTQYAPFATAIQGSSNNSGNCLCMRYE